MFFGGNNQVEKQKGKRTSGFTTRKDGEFSLGWDVSNQMNDFQVKKQQKQQTMATKVTDSKMNENTQVGERPQPTNIEEKCRELIDQYPDITTEELHERLALWELSNKKNIGKPAQRNEGPVAPIKPKESAKNAIYGQMDPSMNATHGKASKRNEGTFSLGDGYNYFKDQNNGGRK